MHAVERSRIICQYLEENGLARVHTLSTLLGVSEVTVRRDLERLEARGLLSRTHGGAVLQDPERQYRAFELPGEPGESEVIDEITEVTLRMINDGETVMLVNGPICTRLADRLERRGNLTVLTNSLAIADRVAGQPTNHAVLLGGEMDTQEKAVFGTMAIENVRRFFVNRLIIEVDGISEDLEMSVTSQAKADLIRSVMPTASHTTVVCLPEHFAANAFTRLDSLEVADAVVTSPSVDDRHKARIFDQGIPLFTSVVVFEGSA